MLGLGLVLSAVGWYGALVASEIALAATLLALRALGDLSPGDVLARTLDGLNRLGRGEWVVHLGERVIAQFQRTGERADAGYRVMDLSRLGGGDCYKGDSIEVAFDATHGVHVEFLEQALFPTFEGLRGNGDAVGGYVSLRFTQSSCAFLAMQRWPVTCSIEVALLRGMRGNAEIFRMLERAAVDHGGTIHWGQRITVRQADVERMYPELGRWREQLARIAATEADADLFDSDFSSRCGLEPA